VNPTCQQLKKNLYSSLLLFLSLLSSHYRAGVVRGGAAQRLSTGGMACCGGSTTGIERGFVGWNEKYHERRRKKKMRKILLVRLVELLLVPHLAPSLVQCIILDQGT
jgi:hypothetical protein